MNFVFIEGKYNGSIFTIFDWNSVFEKVGEMEEIRGSGLSDWLKDMLKLVLIHGISKLEMLMFSMMLMSCIIEIIYKI